MTVRNIAMVKPEKARAVEDYFLRSMQGKPMADKISESQVIGVLEKISESEEKARKTTITVKRVGIRDDVDIDDDF